MLSIKQLTLLPINEKLRLRDMMFRKDINQTELNEINCKYDFKINKINYLDNDLPLNYQGYNLTDKQIKLLGELHTLKLWDCSNITNESVKMLGRLHTLNLSFCPNITDESVKILGGLHTLKLYNCQNITNESVKRLGGVHTLNLSFC